LNNEDEYEKAEKEIHGEDEYKKNHKIAIELVEALKKGNKDIEGEFCKAIEELENRIVMLEAKVGLNSDLIKELKNK